MMMTPEPFLGYEISYRQQRVADDFRRRALARAYRPVGRRRHWVPRRPHLRLPQQRRRPLAAA